MEKAKPGQATLFSTRVENWHSRRVGWKRANDNVAWSERAFVRNRVEMEVKSKQGLEIGYYASSVVTKRRVTSFNKAAWRESYR